MLTRIAALTLASALALAGCGGGANEEPAAEGTSGEPTVPSPSPTPSVTTDLEVPDGVELTAPGTQLSFGDAATVAFEVERPSSAGGQAKGDRLGADGRRTAGTVLSLRVDSARKGSLKDLKGFRLTDPYQRKANYFYVRVTVRNQGAKRFGDVGVPLWGISGENTLLPPVQFTSAFAKCPTEPLPVGFRPGARFQTCLVFLSPDKGSLEGVSYRPTEDFTPIEWRGKVAGRSNGRG